MAVDLILLGIALIIFFGFFAEYMFKRLGIPDVLLLVLLGFMLGPNIFGWVNPSDFDQFAPLFTTFALMFLMFDGSLRIQLGSFSRGLISGSSMSVFNFLISCLSIAGVLYAFFSFEPLISLLMGCILGGVSSAFVVPVLKQLNMKGQLFAVLTLEAALTDVYTIVFSLTILQIIKVNDASFQVVLNQIMSLFAIACLLGFIAAMLWIFLDKKFFAGSKGYMSTIAFLMLLYLATEYLGGNGAIAAMFFGIFLKNSKQLTSILTWIQTKSEKQKEEAIEGKLGVSVLSESEELFFSQVSFFLKTFFFVYIGLLLNIRDHKAILIGVSLAVVILIVRRLSFFLSGQFNKQEQSLLNAVFARGLAAAAIIQLSVRSGAFTDSMLVDITYVFIVATIVLSSINIFYHKMRFKNQARINGKTVS